MEGCGVSSGLFAKPRLELGRRSHSGLSSGASAKPNEPEPNPVLEDEGRNELTQTSDAEFTSFISSPLFMSLASVVTEEEQEGGEKHDATDAQSAPTVVVVKNEEHGAVSSSASLEPLAGNPSRSLISGFNNFLQRFVPNKKGAGDASNQQGTLPKTTSGDATWAAVKTLVLALENVLEQLETGVLVMPIADPVLRASKTKFLADTLRYGIQLLRNLTSEACVLTLLVYMTGMTTLITLAGAAYSAVRNQQADNAPGAKDGGSWRGPVTFVVVPLVSFAAGIVITLVVTSSIITCWRMPARQLYAGNELGLKVYKEAVPSTKAPQTAQPQPAPEAVTLVTIEGVVRKVLESMGAKAQLQDEAKPPSGSGLSSSGPHQGCRGLQNLGNTCYIGAVVQALSCIPEIVDCMHGNCSGGGGDVAALPTGGGGGGGGGAAFLAGGGSGGSGTALLTGGRGCEANVLSLLTGGGGGATGASVTPSFRQLLQALRGEGEVSVSGLREVMSVLDPRWKDGLQQDSQDFLLRLLEALQREADPSPTLSIPKYVPPEGNSEEELAAAALSYARACSKSPLDELLQGQLQNSMQCTVCGNNKHSFEAFSDLSLPIPKGAWRETSVLECLATYTSTEELDGADSVDCDFCLSRQPHTKALRISHPPPVLVLTFKRFSKDEQQGQGKCASVDPAAVAGVPRAPPARHAKNSKPVLVDPDTLDLAPFCSPVAVAAVQSQGAGAGAALAPPTRPVYQLMSIVHHTGSSIERGHYTTVGRAAADPERRSWYCFDDEAVQPVPKPSGPSDTPYILMYRLITCPSTEV